MRTMKGKVMPKHAPGPWNYVEYVDKNFDFVGFVYDGDADNPGNVAEVPSHDNYDNGPLIEAAPELVELLEDAHKCLYAMNGGPAYLGFNTLDMQTMHAKRVALLAKLTGEGQ